MFACPVGVVVRILWGNASLAPQKGALGLSSLCGRFGWAHLSSASRPQWHRLIWRLLPSLVGQIPELGSFLLLVLRSSASSEVCLAYLWRSLESSTPGREEEETVTGNSHHPQGTSGLAAEARHKAAAVLCSSREAVTVSEEFLTALGHRLLRAP